MVSMNIGQIIFGFLQRANMTREQIEFLKSLDKEQMDGTIQSVLLSEGLTTKSFESVCKHLLLNLKAEKDHLIQDNIRLSKELNNG